MLSPRGYSPGYALMIVSHRVLRYCTPALHALADDVEVFVHVRAIYVRIQQTSPGQRQQAIENQQGRRIALPVNPIELSVQPVTSRAEEI